MTLAQRIVESLRPPFELEAIVVDVQASIGIASFPDDGSDVESLLQKADVAMYCAKETRSNVALYDERHDHHSPGRLALSADLRRALQEGGLVAWYQPELDLERHTVLALEALVRWQHPQLGLLPPAAFLEMAEHTSLIKPLTQRVLETALDQLKRWRGIEPDLVVAVNISTAVLIDHQFTDMVLSTLENAGVPPARLKLEVTESTLMADPKVARACLQELSTTGIEVSIDDFGTGYSSLAYLADLPVSEVKIDRSFVGRMGVGTRESIIVNSTIDLAHHLGLRAVAEGVEDPAAIATLKNLGCDVVQGYAICPPLDAAAMTEWLMSSGSMVPLDALRVAA
jgi:EAL domain-containing protein (putative c-di-GMP-specific phosphodiesterase class I)